MKNADLEIYVTRYVKDKKSVKEIAEEFNTYANKIRRSLIRQGVKIRGRSEAQINALETGSSVHPTLGKERTQAEKDTIAQAVSDAWTDERKQRKSVTQKKFWDKIPEYKKKEYYSLAAKANRKASKEGSHLEKFLLDGLRAHDYQVEFHKEGFIERQKMQIDLFLPKIMLAIEIDGPSHFLPIWGEEILEKKIKADAYKNGLLMKAGYGVLRLKNRKKNMSNIQMKSVLTDVIKMVQYIEGLSGKRNKIFELEIV